MFQRDSCSVMENSRTMTNSKQTCKNVKYVTDFLWTEMLSEKLYKFKLLSVDKPEKCRHELRKNKTAKRFRMAEKKSSEWHFYETFLHPFWAFFK